MPDIAVLDSIVHYQDSGAGVPFVFLHGSPGSSRLWRNVLPRIGPGRLLAPDLIGMGHSGRPELAYQFADHARYLDGWFDALDLEGVVLVGHDWGGALACDWAVRHPGRLRGLALMESIIKPMASSDLSHQARQRHELLRSQAGETAALEQDIIVRGAFTKAVLTPIADSDLDAYLALYPTPDSRRPLLAWARQVPLDGEPAELVARIEAYDAWLASSPEVPKLLMTFEGSPTLLIGKEVVEWCSASISALEVVHCGAAGHHAPEDRPEEIAEAVGSWADRLELR